MARNSPERSFFFFQPNARFKAYFLITNVWWDFVMYPYIESMALREHLFVKIPKWISHLGLALALRFHLLHPFT